jgi:type III secretory pathway component EscT
VVSSPIQSVNIWPVSKTITDKVASCPFLNDQQELTAALCVKITTTAKSHEILAGSCEIKYV